MAVDLASIDAFVIDEIKKSSIIFDTVRGLADANEVLEPSADGVPAALTLVNGARFAEAEGNSRYQQGEVTITVFVKAKNVTGGREALRGRNGAYECASVVVDALIGKIPTGACGQLELVEIETLAATDISATIRVEFVAGIEESY